MLSSTSFLGDSFVAPDVHSFCNSAVSVEMLLALPVFTYFVVAFAVPLDDFGH